MPQVLASDWRLGSQNTWLAATKSPDYKARRVLCGGHRQRHPRVLNPWGPRPRQTRPALGILLLPRTCFTSHLNFMCLLDVIHGSFSSLLYPAQCILLINVFMAFKIIRGQQLRSGLARLWLLLFFEHKKTAAHKLGYYKYHSDKSTIKLNVFLASTNLWLSVMARFTSLNWIEIQILWNL